MGSCYSCSLFHKFTKQKSSSSTWVMLATEWHLSCHDVMQCFVMSMTGDISLHMNLSILTLLLTLLDWLLARKPWIWEVLKFSSYSVRCIAFLVAKQKCKGDRIYRLALSCVRNHLPTCLSKLTLEEEMKKLTVWLDEWSDDGNANKSKSWT